MQLAASKSIQNYWCLKLTKNFFLARTWFAFCNPPIKQVLDYFFANILPDLVWSEMFFLVCEWFALNPVRKAVLFLRFRRFQIFLSIFGFYYWHIYIWHLFMAKIWRPKSMQLNLHNIRKIHVQKCVKIFTFHLYQTIQLFLHFDLMWISNLSSCF